LAKHKTKKTQHPSQAKNTKPVKDKQLILVENKYFVFALFAVFSVLVYLASTYKITGDDDFFWHLATGRYIIEHHSVPDKDIFGFAAQGAEWIPFEWGWDVLTYGLESLGGYNLILVFRSLVYVLIFYLFFRLLRRHKVNSIIIFIVLFTLLVAIMDRLSPRPHILTYLFFVTIITILTSIKYIDRDKYFKRLYFLPLIFLVWGNIHMGVLAGGLYLFIFTVSEIIIYYYPQKFSSNEIRSFTKNQLSKLFIISVVCALVLLVNPHGFQTYIYAYGHTKMKMLQTVNEWRSPFDSFFATGFITTLYKVMLFGGLLILLYAYSKKDPHFALVYIGFAIYSVRAIRFTVDYEIIITFFLAVSLNYFVVKWMSSKSFGSSFRYVLYNNLVKVILIIPMLYIIVNIPNDEIYHMLKYYRPFGYGIDKDFIPVQLFNFMKENNISGRPYNQFGTGGYLVWNFPGQKNFIDSRNLNDAIFNEYDFIMQKTPGFEKKIDEYGFDYVIYLDPDLIRRYQGLQRTVVSYFSENQNWKLVFWDDKSLLFLKDISKFSEVINKYNYRIMNPYTALFNLKEFEKEIKADPMRAKEEMDRKLKEEPSGFLIENMARIARQVVPGL
jgi:hypothetical protein